MCLKQAQADLRAIGVMTTKPPFTNHHHQPPSGYYGNVHRDDVRRLDDHFLDDDDLTGHRGDVYIEWDEGWRPILTPKQPPPINLQNALCFPAGNPWGLR